METILVTGGAGYIGSHTCAELLAQGYQVVVVDNLCNGSKVALERVQEISKETLTFYEVDVGDRQALSKVFSSHKIDAVIHFAGLKAVGESSETPLRYYHENVGGTISLLEVMADHGIKSIVFSSSATVYGLPDELPIRETAPVLPASPYGQAKLMVECILKDVHQADPSWKISILRYFNPVGAHPSGRIGENPKGVPNNLTPYITQVAVGKLDCLKVFGGDFDTIDGTGMRDYIHVIDLAKGHVKALTALPYAKVPDIYNMGTGQPASVKQVLEAFEQACKQKIPFEIVGRREGDIDKYWADPEKARIGLEWSAEKTLGDMAADAWRWQHQNPDGYE